MADGPVANPTPKVPSVRERLRDNQPTRRELSASFWRMLATLYPHRKAMIWGLVLGFGVALTYATSLAGMLPVLSVLIEKQGPHEYLQKWADKADGKSAFYASWLRQAAGWFPPQAPSADPDAAGATAMRSLIILLAVLLAINIIGNIFRVFSQYLVLYATHRAMMDLRRRMYRKALTIPLTALGGELSGIISQFLSDSREVSLGIVTLFGKIAREPLKAICVLIVALIVDARLTLTVLAIAPPAVGLLWYFGRKIRKATVRLLEGYGLMLAALEETLQGAAVVKSYNQEHAERKRMWSLERRMLKQSLKLSWVEAISSPLIEVAGILIAAAGIVWLAQRVVAGEIPPSKFMLMVGLLAAMLDPIRKVANVYNMVQRSSAAAHRIFTFLDSPEEGGRAGATERGTASGVGKAAGSKPVPAYSRSNIPTTAPRVAFRDVHFRYAPDAQPALNGLTLTVEPGECVAVVGPNGSGKSTLLRLLPRLLEPQEGAIEIDGVEIRDIPLRALRRQIALVDQRAVIFARSVAENIAYGNRSASREDIERAARSAYAAEFIANLPQQYDTRIGEFGTTLSGGQRQRISIARAFLKPARILIFDEATSEIDAESEAKIHAALDELRRGKTTFLIAHRHTVMDMADRIAVLDAGKLVDFGTHEELTQRCPLYVALYRSPGA
jgi:subfamily B ATP-binding cassette protein MsbA